MTFRELHIGAEFMIAEKKYLKMGYSSARRESDGSYVGIPQDREVEILTNERRADLGRDPRKW